MIAVRGYPLRIVATAWLVGWAATFFGFAALTQLDMLLAGQVAAFFGETFDTADAIPPAAKLVLGGIFLTGVILAAPMAPLLRFAVLGLSALAGLIAASRLPEGHALVWAGSSGLLAGGPLIGGVIASLMLSRKRAGRDSPLG